MQCRGDMVLSDIRSKYIGDQENILEENELCIASEPVEVCC